MEKSHASKGHRARRVARGLLNIILPLQDVSWYQRSTRDMTARNIERMQKAFPELLDRSGETADDSPAVDDTSWQRAVAESGRTPEQLDAGYRASRWRWRAMFWLLTIPVPLFMLTPLYGLGPLTFNALMTCLVLFSGAGVAWLKALIITYRLWQLRTRRVSLAERGTFRHFLAETHATRDAITGR